MVYCNFTTLWYYFKTKTRTLSSGDSSIIAGTCAIITRCLSNCVSTAIVTRNEPIRWVRYRISGASRQNEWNACERRSPPRTCTRMSSGGGKLAGKSAGDSGGGGGAAGGGRQDSVSLAALASSAAMHSRHDVWSVYLAASYARLPGGVPEVVEWWGWWCQ